ncbi:MAG TPA: M1 family aminopeptidase [Gemmatimonadales bacterium]|nr:M1 family aminopeptidase [Gemmatimonadales bacterium]
MAAGAVAAVAAVTTLAAFAIVTDTAGAGGRIGLHRFRCAAALSILLLPGPWPGRAFAQSRPPATLSGPGISEALARYRAATIADVRYALDLDLTAPDSATGQVTVRFRHTGGDDVILDFRGRRLGAVTVNGGLLPDATPRQGHLLIPARRMEEGENVLRLEFVADIAPAGASIIRTHDPSDGGDYLYTLLVPADASQLFPCFDQPDLKARVRLGLTAPAGWAVIANGSVASTDSSGDRVTSRFTETQPISTYLIAFAAGPWQRVTTTAGGRPISAWVRRSRASEADLDTLLALNRRALDWMEHWFGRPYPFEKFDFVLAPAFPFGGMEHPGAVFYSEDGFIFRERPTLPRRLARFSTILHEVAHQWFGDLVTMRWFDDLWLKEGFATFMAAKGLAELEPGADAWKTFYLGNKPSAYAVDQTAGTRPLWQELDNLDRAKSNYGAIVYNKAPAVLRQLEHLVGDSVFQTGLRQFIRRHAYANATWQDLLGAVGTAAGRPLEQFGREFMLRAGMPVIEQRVTLRAGRIAGLELAQHPAVEPCRLDAVAAGRSGRHCDRSRAAAGTVVDEGTWTQRVELLLAYRDRAAVRLPVELRGAVTAVPAAVGRPAPDYVFANAGDFGYGLVLLDSASVRTLEQGGLGRTSDAFLRAMLWGAMWDQVRGSRLSPSRYVRLALRELPAEQDEQLVPVILGRLDRAVSAYLSAGERDRVQPRLEQVLWAGAADSGRAYGVRKAFVDAYVDLAASPGGVARLDRLLDADSVAGAPLRDPTRWDIAGRLLQLGAATADRRLDQQAQRDTTPDGRRRAFIAGAGRPSPATKRDYFTRYFADTTLNEEWASGSLGAFNTLAQQTLTRPFLGPALDSLPFIQAHRRIFFLESWLAAFLRGQTGAFALATVQRYLDTSPALPLDLRRKVLQHMDELARTVRIRGAPAP